MKNPRRNSSRKKPSEFSEEEKKNPSEVPDVAGFAKYSNIIYLMIGAVAVAFGAGYFLDKLFHLSFPVFKVVFSFGGVILALYLVFKELNRK